MRFFPPLIILGIHILGLGIAIAKNGQTETGKHNATSTFIAVLVMFSLYWWAGLFSVFFTD